jgi:hypothetical protein
MTTLWTVINTINDHAERSVSLIERGSGRNGFGNACFQWPQYQRQSLEVLLKDSVDFGVGDSPRCIMDSFLKRSAI